MERTKKRFNLKIKSNLFSRKNNKPIKKLGLAPRSKNLTNFYGFIAVLLVLIPEWLAEGAIFLSKTITDHEMPKKGVAWHLEDELRLASMSLFELRKLAKETNLIGYSSDNRFLLIQRILTKLNQKNKSNQSH